jgi:hypothetical protein
VRQWSKIQEVLLREVTSKYIIFQTVATGSFAVVFPEHIEHSMIRKAMEAADPAIQVLRAGFCSHDGKRVFVWGESKLLQKKSESSDVVWLEEIFRPNGQKAKYLVFESAVLSWFPLVFPEFIEHTLIQRAMNAEYPGIPPVSAGFCSQAGGEVLVSGEAKELRLKSAEEDAVWLERVLLP